MAAYRRVFTNRAKKLGVFVASSFLARQRSRWSCSSFRAWGDQVKVTNPGTPRESRCSICICGVISQVLSQAPSSSIMFFTPLASSNIFLANRNAMKSPWAALTVILIALNSCANRSFDRLIVYAKRLFGFCNIQIDGQSFVSVNHLISPSGSQSGISYPPLDQRASNVLSDENANKRSYV